MSAAQSATAVTTHRTATYVLVRTLMAAIFRVAFRRRLAGLEHLPPSGGVMIVANHQSFLDIPLIAVSTQRHVSFVARASLADSRFLAFVMRACGAVLVRRGRADRAAMREMVEHLERGDCLAVFPEGTRTPDGTVQAFRSGALIAARKAGVPIVPAAIRGTFEAWPRQARWPRPRRVGLRYAPAVDAGGADALESLHATVSELVGDGRFAASD